LSTGGGQRAAEPLNWFFSVGKLNHNSRAPAENKQINFYVLASNANSAGKVCA
jgi:hypothetical protein